MKIHMELEFLRLDFHRAEGRSVKTRELKRDWKKEWTKSEEVKQNEWTESEEQREEKEERRRIWPKKKKNLTNILEQTWSSSPTMCCWVFPCSSLSILASFFSLCLLGFFALLFVLVGFFSLCLLGFFAPLSIWNSSI